jgi:hypothetical protein
MNLKKLKKYLRVNVLGLGPRLIKKRIYRAAVSRKLRNTGLQNSLYNAGRRNFENSIYFVLGNSPASEFYMQKFRNTLSDPSS